ncbi:AMP-binding protein [Candidatus Phycosocius spiralis]|uniref:Acyl-ACP synthetase n=1 Tax=Candidatus Phycosocius spiralis TaxID=2815099 RepID=A0ABQ4PSJ5_9PROT|nr:AMP-binding protein [Candidatus Phycosocius spiralis]GIU65980.1 acyl-ACP synthetase [Candidatus Phycosocius spiralis]
MPLRPFDIARTRRSIFDALLDARGRFGGSKEILEDPDRTPITYDRLVFGSLVLGRKISGMTALGENVGMLIANSVGAIVTLFGLLAFGRTPAMLNFTAGTKNIHAACNAAQVKTIFTARRFVEQAHLTALIEDLGQEFRIIYLEDIRDQITPFEKARGLIDATVPFLAQVKINPDATAVMLFTSGTEGIPKGVALSHANLIANVEQVAGHVDLNPDDMVFNPLPIFHCFGLTGGTFLPLLQGMKCILYPSPLQANSIVKLIRETQATILVGTDTFVNHYARQADEEDLTNLRFVVCGAERVKEETRQTMMSRFNVPIIEGYGATEASPIIAVNTPNHLNRPGTCGRLLPEIQWKLESIPGIDGGGRLYVRGPNVMRGYVRVDAPGEIQPLAGGWHDTGDVVAIDKDGYLTIKGRVKRFAKIGGEMVSLTAVENYATSCWPDHLHAAVAVSDPKKGEQILLLSDCSFANRSDLLAWYKINGAAELALPKKIIKVKEIPLLGTGKIDYGYVQHLAQDKSNAVGA